MTAALFNSIIINNPVFLHQHLSFPEMVGSIILSWFFQDGIINKTLLVFNVTMTFP